MPKTSKQQPCRGKRTPHATIGMPQAAERRDIFVYLQGGVSLPGCSQKWLLTSGAPKQLKQKTWNVLELNVEGSSLETNHVAATNHSAPLSQTHVKITEPAGLHHPDHSLGVKLAVEERDGADGYNHLGACVRL